MTAAQLRAARLAWLALSPRERRNLSFDDLLSPTPAQVQEFISEIVEDVIIPNMPVAALIEGNI